jgi:hypothetical protein
MNYSQKHNYDNQENINPESDIENNNGNNINNSVINLDNILDKTPKINKEYKLNIPALKRIENILSSKANTLNTKNSFKTELKPSKPYLQKNINKTFNKPGNNNIFTYTKDEKYSLLKIKKIKNKKFSPYKSTNQLYNNVENIYDDLKNEDYFKMNKNKKIYSLRKVYMSIVSYTNEKGDKKEFNIFQDEDIGLSRAPKIKNLFIDDDINSDDETIDNGIKRCMQNITSAINYVKKHNNEYVSEYKKCFGI